MAGADPILNAIARLEERLVERWDEWRRDFVLDLDGRFDAIHKRLDRLEQEYEMMRAGMARLEADVGTLKADVATLNAAVQRMERDIASLRVSIESLEARLRQDQSDRQDLRDQLLDCRHRLGVLEERVQSIESRLPQD